MHRAVCCIWAELFTPFLGEGYYLAGEYDKAKQILQELLEIAERWGMKFHIGCARTASWVISPWKPTQLRLEHR